MPIYRLCFCRLWNYLNPYSIILPFLYSLVFCNHTNTHTLLFYWYLIFINQNKLIYSWLLFFTFIPNKNLENHFFVWWFDSDTKLFLFFFGSCTLDICVFHRFSKNWIIHELEKICLRVIFCIFSELCI